MAQITGLTAARMLEIEGESVVDGRISGDDLILTRHDGTDINAGSVRGPVGLPGKDAAPGSVAPTANTTPIRTADGRVKTAAPTEVDDSTTKKYVDDLTAPFAAKSYVDQSDLMNRKIGRAQHLLSGGGIRKVDSSGISWGQRFLVMGLGRVPASTPSGFFDITMPPDGTSIPVTSYGTTTPVSVAGGMIPLPNWRALYYDLPFGSANTSDPSRFHLVDYTADSVDIPPSWVLIAVRNGDTNSPSVMWGDGRKQDYWRTLTLQNSWVVYGSSWPPLAYRFSHDGRIVLRGLVRSGTTGAAVCTFAANLVPEGIASTGLIFNQAASGGMARVDVHGDGTVVVQGYFAGATNGFVSFDGMNWYPVGS